MKKLLILLLLIVPFLAFGGGSNQPAPAAPTAPAAPAQKKAGGTLNSYVTSVSTLNPYESSETDGTTIIEMCSLTLYKFMPSADGKQIVFEGQLAAGDPVSKNSEGTLWEIKLRENAYWENGDRITADDFIYSMQMVLDPVLLTRRAQSITNDYINIAGAEAYYMQKSKGTTVPWEKVGIRKIGDYVIQIETVTYVTPFDVKNHFAAKHSTIVHKPTFDASLSADRKTTTYGLPTGSFKSCGPYILKSWVEGSQFVFERNPKYVLADRVKLDKVVYHVITDNNTALQMFLLGQLDTVSLGAAVKEQYEDDPRTYRMASSDVTSINVNIGNTENNKILGNVNFRHALSYATDRAAVAKLVKGKPATWIVASGIVSSTVTNIPFRDLPEAKAYLPPNNGYDPVKARELFQKALSEVGLKNVTVKMMVSEASATGKAMGEFLQRSWREVLGEQFTLDVSTVSSSVWSTTRKTWTGGNPNTYQMAYGGGWSVSLTDVANGFKTFLSSYGNKNEPYYNTQYDELWALANTSLKGKNDNDYRLAQCFEMEKILLRDMIQIPLFETESYRLISPRVHLPFGNKYTPTLGWGWMYATVD